MTEDVSNLTFELRGFHENLAKVCDLLAELHYIDKALAYLEYIDIPGAPVSVSVGWTYPFDRIVQIGGTKSTEDFQREANEKFQTLIHESRTWADGIHADVLDTVSLLIYLDPSGIDTLTQTTIDIAKSLLLDSDHDFGGLAENLGDWRGQARDAFVNEWYKPFTDIREGQCYIFSQIAGLYSISRGTTASSQHGLMNVVDAAIKAADEQLLKRKERSEGSSLKGAFGMVSTVTGFLSTATFFFPPASLTLGVLSTTTGIASLVIPEHSRETLEIKGANAAELEESLDSNIREQYDNWAKALGGLYIGSDPAITSLRDIDALMASRQSEFRLYPRAPGISDNPDPAEFHHDSSKQY